MSDSTRPQKQTTSVRLDPALRERADAASRFLGLGGVNSVIEIALTEYLDRFDEQRTQQELDELLREAVPALKAIAVAVTALLHDRGKDSSPEK